MTIAWQPHMGKVVESYSLELDDGCGGDFRVRKIWMMVFEEEEGFRHKEEQNRRGG